MSFSSEIEAGAEAMADGVWGWCEKANAFGRTVTVKVKFAEALTFVQRVGDLAESEHHHPDIAFGWGGATVSLQTKKIKGLHKNDFIMAAKIDRIAMQSGARARKQ